MKVVGEILGLQETVACQYKKFPLISCWKSKCMMTQPQPSWIQAFNLIWIPSARHTASPSPDPQCINSPASSHVHTCPSWPAAMATHVNFFQTACSQIFSLHPPFHFMWIHYCNKARHSCALTRSDNPYSPPPFPTHTHKQHTSPKTHTHTHLNRHIKTTQCFKTVHCSVYKVYSHVHTLTHSYHIYTHMVHVYTYF